MSNTIVIYFSHSANDRTFEGPTARAKGNTEIAAEAIRDALGCDIFRVELHDKYKGMAWYVNREILRKTMRGKIEAKHYIDSIHKYDNVFICGPCWWGTYPAVIFSQIKKLKFKGKKVMCLVTHEGIDPDGCIKDIQKKIRGAKFGSNFIILGVDVYTQLQRIIRWASVETGVQSRSHVHE